MMTYADIAKVLNLTYNQVQHICRQSFSASQNGPR